MTLTARSVVVRQTVGYIASVLASNVMALVTTVVLTRILSVDGYARYAFGLNVLVFLSLLFELGMFYPAAQLITKASEREARAITGAAIVLWLGASVLFTVTVLLSTVGPVQALFKIHAAGELRVAAPLAGAWLATQLCLLLAQGRGRLHVYSATDLLSSGLFFACVLGVSAAGHPYGPSLMLVLYGATLLAGCVACLHRLRPTFHHWTSQAEVILGQARTWGFNVYVGRVLSTGTYRLDVLMLGALSGSTPVADYVLATALTAPVGLPGLSSATALFKRMSGSTRIEPKWVVAPLCLSLAATLVLGLVSTPIVDLLFSSKYSSVSGLLLPLALAAVLQGITAVYNRFLAAHERGKELRTTALWLAGANVALNIALIPPWGALGAAWASVFALVVNFVAHLLPYRRLAADLAGRPAGGQMR